MNKVLRRLLKNIGLDFILDILLEEILKQGEDGLAKILKVRMSASMRGEVVVHLRFTADALEKGNFTAASREIVVLLRKIKV